MFLTARRCCRFVWRWDGQENEDAQLAKTTKRGIAALPSNDCQRSSSAGRDLPLKTYSALLLWSACLYVNRSRFRQALALMRDPWLSMETGRRWSSAHPRTTNPATSNSRQYFRFHAYGLSLDLFATARHTCIPWCLAVADA